MKLFDLIEVFYFLVVLGLENSSLARVLSDEIVIYPWQTHSRVAKRGGTRRVHTGRFSAATLMANVPDLCRGVREPEFIPEIRMRGGPQSNRDPHLSWNYNHCPFPDQRSEGVGVSVT